jgi:hypothetical protein
MRHARWLFLPVFFFFLENSLAAKAREFTFRFDPPGKDKGKLHDPGHRFTLSKDRPIDGSAARQRRPQLSPQHLLLLLSDGEGRELGRSVFLDPRVVLGPRIEGSGQVSCQLLYRDSGVFSVAVPELPGAKRLKLFHPHWTGREFELEKIFDGGLQ